jgi:hypothetical protein
VVDGVDVVSGVVLVGAGVELSVVGVTAGGAGVAGTSVGTGTRGSS